MENTSKEINMHLPKGVDNKSPLGPVEGTIRTTFWTPTHYSLTKEDIDEMNISHYFEIYDGNKWVPLEGDIKDE